MLNPDQPKPVPAKKPLPRTPSSAANVADILALGRAAMDAVSRALRSAPEVRSNRVMARWPVDLEDLLLELEPIQAETSISELAARLGVSAAQLRSTALRLQRLALVKVSARGVSLTPVGRQKLARLEMARAAVLRRVAEGAEQMPPEHTQMILHLLESLIDRAESVVDDHLGQKRAPSGVGPTAGNS